MRTTFAATWLAVLLALPAMGGEASSPANTSAEAAAPFAATETYEVRQIEGWKVLVQEDFPRLEPGLCEETLKVLDGQLHEAVRRVPGAAVEKLKQVTIWVELDEPHHPCMAYHPSPDWLREHAMNPDKGGCVEIADARNFLRWTIDQPTMVLHELAHAYHDRFLGGYGNPEIAAAYRRAQEAKTYESVLHIRGRRERAYAMQNPMEYFAEGSEALFGINDFYPFVRAEFAEHDPEGYRLLLELWEK